MNGHRTARRTAEAAGIPLRTTTGRSSSASSRRARSSDVVALAIGARGTPASARPLGSTATAVAVALRKPVLVVPPDADPPARSGACSSRSRARSRPRSRRARSSSSRAASIDVVALHVHDEDSIPGLHRSAAARAAGMGARDSFTATALGGSETSGSRRGSGESASSSRLWPRRCGCDLIALGWSQVLAPGRAPVVQETLAALAPTRPPRSSATPVRPAGRDRSAVAGRHVHDRDVRQRCQRRRAHTQSSRGSRAESKSGQQSTHFERPAELSCPID